MRGCPKRGKASACGISVPGCRCRSIRATRLPLLHHFHLLFGRGDRLVDGAGCGQFARGEIAHAGAKASQTRADADIAEALRAFQAAARNDNPTGPAFVPTREIAGKLLLKLNRPQEARLEFEAALEDHPNRAPSLLGAARAAKAAGDAGAARAYAATLSALWAHADRDLPELVEIASSASAAK